MQKQQHGNSRDLFYQRYISSTTYYSETRPISLEGLSDANYLHFNYAQYLKNLKNIEKYTEYDKRT